ncbi:pentapeptide repeat-containing protein [Endozoicomonas sp. SCSIO W0465]|uniref:pentapeptide repeat-containing protein n=1 Tax=Endozoicomonas sp. SCSIO W0465 TaxID=2918516 RepID=UPI002075B8D8|nr:pentapeptide repeat-containing protein [Endozoicomonas sp. SCSIO W0465]USE38839.1 pentapeptide repeat-containing protein [Endozoicomonas sp. SCSIO W0465]
MTMNSFCQDLLEGLETAEQEIEAQQQMAELQYQYLDYLCMTSSNRPSSPSANRVDKIQLKKALKQYETGSRLTLKKQTHQARLLQKRNHKDKPNLKDQHLQSVLKGRCKPGLARLNPDGMLNLLASWLGSPCSIHQAKMLQKLNVCNRSGKPNLKDQHLQSILKGCCKPELARLIPDDMLNLLASWLGSPCSILEPSRQELIKQLSSPEELRKVIQNNPYLASGNLYNMDDVVFKKGAELPSSDIADNKRLREELNLSKSPCDYSGMSFRGASFPEIYIQDASFRNCDLSNADFTGSRFLSCDFSGADLTAACLGKCSITYCDLNKTTLTYADFGDIEYLSFDNDRSSKTIDLLSGALAEYSKRTNDDQAAQIIRARARMLLASGRREEAEAVYEELIHRQRMEIDDFWLLGESYLESADKLDEDNQKGKAQLAEKAVACFQKGWRVTDNPGDNSANHNLLFNAAIIALRKAGPAFDWRSVLEDIKSTATKNIRILTWMAKTLAKHHEDRDAMNMLLQLVNNQDDIHNKQAHLPTICKTAATIGLRNKEYLTSALVVLEGVTRIALDHYGEGDSFNLFYIGRNVIFNCWLHQLDILVHYGHYEEASNVAFEMNKVIPGTLELFAEKDCQKTAIWGQSSWKSRQLIEKIKATGVTFTAGDALIQGSDSLNTGHISSGLPADPKKAVMPNTSHSQ